MAGKRAQWDVGGAATPSVAATHSGGTTGNSSVCGEGLQANTRVPAAICVLSTYADAVAGIYARLSCTQEADR